MSNEMTRREFVKTAGGGVLGALAWPGDAFAQTRASGTPLRYAIVGTGVRAVGMWGRPIANTYKDAPHTLQLDRNKGQTTTPRGGPAGPVRPLVRPVRLGPDGRAPNQHDTHT